MLLPPSSRLQSVLHGEFTCYAAAAQVASASVLAVLLFHPALAKSKKPEESGIHKIKHVIIIMQENRSFDSYFGTFPGAEGFPMESGVPSVCNPDPKNGGCIKPYHDPQDANGGGPHGEKAALAAIDDSKMDGFVAQAVSTTAAPRGRRGCLPGNTPVCDPSSPSDVMGYHDEREIPNYWTYARTFVLQDHMFEPNASWSLPEHLFQVSAWSAYCTEHDKPESCTNALQAPGMPPDFGGRTNAAFGGEARNGPRGHAAHLCVDRSHLSTTQESRELGILRGEGNGAGLRRRLAGELSAGKTKRQNAWHLESPAVFRHGQG